MYIIKSHARQSRYCILLPLIEKTRSSRGTKTFFPSPPLDTDVTAQSLHSTSTSQLSVANRAGFFFLSLFLPFLFFVQGAHSAVSIFEMCKYRSGIKRQTFHTRRDRIESRICRIPSSVLRHRNLATVGDLPLATSPHLGTPKVQDM